MGIINLFWVGNLLDAIYGRANGNPVILVERVMRALAVYTHSVCCAHVRFLRYIFLNLLTSPTPHSQSHRRLAKKSSNNQRNPLGYILWKYYLYIKCQLCCG